MKKKTVLVLYEFFYPGYKAGGPVQSLVNLVMALGNDYEFKAATTAYDLHTVNPYSEMELNKWNAVKLYNDSSVSVWYSSKIKPSLAEFYQVIRSAKPDIVYINGFYTNHFLYPLLLKKATNSFEIVPVLELKKSNSVADVSSFTFFLNQNVTVIGPPN